MTVSRKKANKISSKTAGMITYSEKHNYRYSWFLIYTYLSFKDLEKKWVFKFIYIFWKNTYNHTMYDDKACELLWVV